MAGDLIWLRDYTVEQLDLRPLNLPPPGQIMQVGQGFQPPMGYEHWNPQRAGVADVHQGAPLPRHTQYEPGNEGGRAYDHNLFYVVHPNVNRDHNKDIYMPANVERERERWGEAHGCPPTQTMTDENAWQYSEYEHDYEGVHEDNSNHTYEDPYVSDNDMQENESDHVDYMQNDIASNPDLGDDPVEQPDEWCNDVSYDNPSSQIYAGYLQGYSNVEGEKPALIPKEWWGGGLDQTPTRRGEQIQIECND